jgi:hypothetical protein
MAPRAALLSAFLLLGCFPPGEGLDPPLSKVYFPVGLAVDERQRFLAVVNSDFDLQYNAGTVQTWDLEQLRARVPHYCESDADCAGRIVTTLGDDDPANDVSNPRTQCHPEARWCVKPGDSPCGLFGEQDDREKALYPGRCGPIRPTIPQDGGDAILPLDDDLEDVAPGRAVVIGAFASDVVRRTLVVPPGEMGDGDTGRERLFIPVRGDATLHWIDLNADGTLYCHQNNSDRLCSDLHRAGDEPEEENTRNNMRMEPEPFGLDADENGLHIVVSNQTSGAVSLFSHVREPDAIAWEKGPRFVWREGGMPQRPIGVANVPVPLAMPSSGREHLPGFLVSFRNAHTVFMVRVYDDAESQPSRPFLRRYEAERIQTNSSGIDSRGIGVDPFRRHAAENDCLARFGTTRQCAQNPLLAGCDAARDPLLQECLTSAAAVPLDVFIANRAPSSLVIGETIPLVSDSATSDIPSFSRNLPLDVGPSRVYVGDIINLQGQRERRIFVLCFDSRRIAIYDPIRRELETEIVTGRGPHGFAIDTKVVDDDPNDAVVGPNDEHAYAYIGHFLDSYVGVVDLDQRHKNLYGKIIANVGKPSPPRASK